MARTRLQRGRATTRMARIQRSTAVRRARRASVAVYRSTVRDTAVGNRLSGWYRDRRAAAAVTVVERDGFRKVESDDALVIESVDDALPRRGIYLYGGCDLPTAFELESTLEASPHGTVAIFRQPRLNLGRAATPVVLQTLDRLPDDVTRETVERLKLPADYFEPVLFDPCFEVGVGSYEPFGKSVVLLSGGADIVRTLYRHREHGFWVDPGGGWLEGIAGSAALDRDALAWFTKHFEKVGRIDLDTYCESWRRLVEAIRRHTGAEVVVLNTLTVEPGDRTHNYQLRRHPEEARRRRFQLAQAELSQELDFGVVDTDRTLKWCGIHAQLDFAHFPTDKMKPLAAELAVVLRERGIL